MLRISSSAFITGQFSINKHVFKEGIVHRFKFITAHFSAFEALIKIETLGDYTIFKNETGELFFKSPFAPNNIVKVDGFTTRYLRRVTDMSMYDPFFKYGLIKNKAI